MRRYCPTFLPDDAIRSGEDRAVPPPLQLMQPTRPFASRYRACVAAEGRRAPFAALARSSAPTVNGTGSLTIPIPTSPGLRLQSSTTALSTIRVRERSFSFGAIFASRRRARPTKGCRDTATSHRTSSCCLAPRTGSQARAEQCRPVGSKDESHRRWHCVVVRDYVLESKDCLRASSADESLDPADVFWRSLPPANVTTVWQDTSSQSAIPIAQPASSLVDLREPHDKGVRSVSAAGDSDGVDLCCTRVKSNYGDSRNEPHLSAFATEIATRMCDHNLDDYIHRCPTIGCSSRLRLRRADPAMPLPGTEASAGRRQTVLTHRASFEVRTHLCQRVLMFTTSRRN